MVTQAQIDAVNKGFKSGQTASQIKQTVTSMDKKTVISSSNASKPQTVKTVTQEKPGFFSVAGQQQAFARVGNIYNPMNLFKPVYLSNGQDVGKIVRPVTLIAEAGSILYGGALALTKIPSVLGFGAGTSTTAGASTGFGFKTGVALFSGGLLASSLFSDKNAPQTITQTPNQITNTTQTTTTNQNDYSIRPVDQSQRFIISGSPNSSIYGSQSATPTGQSQEVTPIQQVIPTQDTSAGQSQTSGINPLLILAGLGILVLMKGE